MDNVTTRQTYRHNKVMVTLLLLTAVAVVLWNGPATAENVCEFGKPQMYCGKEVFCGRGPNSQDCADGYKCKIDATDRYAVCCPVRRELSLIFSSFRPRSATPQNSSSSMGQRPRPLFRGMGKSADDGDGQRACRPRALPPSPQND
ncbi:hypothetical protein LSAT2_028108 [Lamellibrachia satsuma]|nr:hypothetical protein LSAT2_028108 [Lamellibrachia satsuma]